MKTAKTLTLNDTLSASGRLTVMPVGPGNGGRVLRVFQRITTGVAALELAGRARRGSLVVVGRRASTAMWTT